MRLHLGLHSKLPMICGFSLVLALVLWLSGVGSAHRPLFSGTDASNPDSAMRFPDPSVSHVIYYELTVEAPYRWFVFENEKLREVAIQLGVPAGEPGEGIDPVMLLFGPGFTDLPDWLPFVPAQGVGEGAIEIPRADKPRHFDEPITGTKSWILVDTHVPLPSSGTYYGVVYDRNGQEGKVWVSVGQREGFGWRDVFRLPGWIRNVRQFHQVSGWPRWVWIGASGILGVAAIALGWVVRRWRRRA